MCHHTYRTHCDEEVRLPAEEREKHVQQGLNAVAVGLAAHRLSHAKQDAIVLLHACGGPST